MIRQPHIRFFISSTFSDMTLERRTLRKIFEHLEYKYSSMGWKISYVDLRWGISPDMQKRNRTMEVCLEEIERCKSISPKPNFILLLGQRYGWVPLPEQISKEKFKYLLVHSDVEVQGILSRAYRYDENYMPCGVYRQLTQYEVCDTVEDYENKIVVPLRAFFSKHAPELLHSATEQEIMKGIFESHDAREHVVAYMREFNRCDMPNLDIYFDGMNRVGAIKRKIKKLNLKYTLEKKLDWEDYNSYIIYEFQENMNAILSKIIDEEIARHKNERITDNERHIDAAVRISSDFIGRKKELESLRRYVTCSNPSGKKLLLRNDKDCGTSTLLAQLVKELYEEGETNVIARFCEAVTPLSAHDFLKSLFDDIQSLHVGKGRRYEYDEFMNLWGRNSDCLVECVGNIGKNRRVLILIDSIDAIETITEEGYEMRDISRLFGSWALPENLRVIISVNRYSSHKVSNYDKFIIFELESLSHDIENLTAEYLAKHRRTLTPSQMRDWITSVKSYPSYFSTASELFLSLHWLLDLRSWDMYFPGLDNNYVPGKIFSLYLKKIVASGEVPEALTRCTLKLLATSVTGIPEEKLLNKLTALQEVRDSQKYMLYDDPTDYSIPPSLWSRVLLMLNPVVGHISSPGGLVIGFKDSTVRDRIRETLGTLPDEFSSILLGNHVDKDQWALYELPNAFIELASIKESEEEIVELLELFESYVGELYYLGEKYTAFYLKIIEDFQAYVAISKRCHGNYEIAPKLDEISRLKDEVLSLPRPKSIEHFISMIAGLGYKSVANRKLSNMIGKYPEYFNSYLVDVLKDESCLQSIRKCTGILGKFPSHDRASTKVAYFDFDTLVVREIDSGEVEEISFETQGDVKGMVANEELTQFVTIFENSSFLTTIYLGGTTVTGELRKGKKQWAQFSTSGAYLVSGGEEMPICIFGGDVGKVNGYLYHTMLESKFTSGFIAATKMWLMTERQLYLAEFPSLKVIRTLDISAQGGRIREATDTSVLIEFPREETITSFIVIDVISVLRHYSFRVSEEGSPISAVTIVPVEMQPVDVVVFFDNGGWTRFSYSETMPCKIKTGSTYQVISARYGLANLLSLRDRIIFDFDACVNKYVRTNARTGGINTLAVDRRGDVIAVAHGKNFLQERYSTLPVYIKEGDGYRLRMIEVKFEYPSTCAVSDDGRYFAYSAAGRIYCGIVCGSEIKQFDHRSCGITHIKFTRSNHIVAVTGDYIADAEAECFVYDIDGNIISHITPKGSGFSLMRMKFMMSPNDRYLILDGAGVIDLKEEKFIKGLLSFSPGFCKREMHIYDDIFPCGVFSRDSRYFYTSLSQDFLSQSMGLCRLNLGTGEIEQIGPSLRVMDMTIDGQKLICVTETLVLCMFGLISGDVIELPLTNVFAAVACNDGRHLYVITYNSEIYYTDLSGTIIARVACRGIQRFALCEKGLAIADGNGEIHLFTSLE